MQRKFYEAWKPESLNPLGSFIIIPKISKIKAHYASLFSYNILRSRIRDRYLNTQHPVWNTSVWNTNENWRLVAARAPGFVFCQIELNIELRQSIGGDSRITCFTQKCKFNSISDQTKHCRCKYTFGGYHVWNMIPISSWQLFKIKLIDPSARTSLD